MRRGWAVQGGPQAHRAATRGALDRSGSPTRQTGRAPATTNPATRALTRTDRPTNAAGLGLVATRRGATRPSPGSGSRLVASVVLVVSGCGGFVGGRGGCGDYVKVNGPTPSRWGQINLSQTRRGRRGRRIAIVGSSPELAGDLGFGDAVGDASARVLDLGVVEPTRRGRTLGSTGTIAVSDQRARGAVLRHTLNPSTEPSPAPAAGAT